MTWGGNPTNATREAFRRAQAAADREREGVLRRMARRERQESVLEEVRGDLLTRREDAAKLRP